jgi:hypothetical protein
MESKDFTPPSQRDFEYALNQAEELAVRELRQVTDFAGLCQRSGASYRVADNHPVIILKYLNRDYHLRLPEADIRAAGSDEPVPQKRRILLLHYLRHARGTPPGGRAISFQDLPQGLSYHPTFTKRTISPLARHFGPQPHKLVETAAELGAGTVATGDAAVVIPAFPRVPVTLVVWAGDAEFPPSGGIMFDETITDYLPVEDIIVLCEDIIWTLVKRNRVG